MNWYHVIADGGKGQDEQWLFRPDDTPTLASLRRYGDLSWQISLLHLTGVGCRVLFINETATLAEAKALIEEELTLIGWRWGQ